MDENNKTSIDRFINNTLGLVESYLKLFRLEMTIGLAQAITMVVIVLTIGSLLAFVGFFASMAFAYSLTEWLEISLPLSFLIITGIYIIILIVVVRSQRLIRKFIFTVLEKVINHKND